MRDSRHVSNDIRNLKRTPLKTTESCKIVLVGDDGVGKTSLCYSFRDGRAPDVDIPSIINSQLLWLVVDDCEYSLQLWDTVAIVDAWIRRLSYISADVFLVCFSLVDVESLEHVRSRWVPEIGRGRAVLVGLKSDLKGQERVSRERIEDVKRWMRCDDYVECSAKENANVEDVFATAVRVAKARRKGCSVA